MTDTERLRALGEKWRVKAQHRYDNAELLRGVGEDLRAATLEARADENRAAAAELIAALVRAPLPALDVQNIRAEVQDKLSVANACDMKTTRGQIVMKQCEDFLVEMFAPLPVNQENQMTETRSYPCGCSATGTAPLPNYCPEHAWLTADEIYRVMQAWEGQPASEEQTRIVVKLGVMRDGAIRAGDSPLVTPLDQPIPAALPASVAPHWHLSQEVTTAHQALDKAHAPKTKLARKRECEGEQEITMGLAERIAAIPASVAAPPPGVDPRISKGLYGKFEVHRTDGRDKPGEKHHGCTYFVLDLQHDKHIVPALRAYAESCETDYPALARDLSWVADDFGKRDEFVGLIAQKPALDLEQQRKMAAPASPPDDPPQAECYEPPKGGRIVKIFRDGSWMADSPAGHRRHYSWPDVAPPPDAGWQQVLFDMRRANALVDEAEGPQDYQTRLIALAMVARQFLRVAPPGAIQVNGMPLPAAPHGEQEPA
jgi:hypothetical protein